MRRGRSPRFFPHSCRSLVRFLLSPRYADLFDIHTPCRCKAEEEEWSDLIRLASSAARRNSCCCPDFSRRFTAFVRSKFTPKQPRYSAPYGNKRVSLLVVHEEGTPEKMTAHSLKNIASVNHALWFNSYTCRGRENRWFSEVTANAPLHAFMHAQGACTRCA